MRTWTTDKGWSDRFLPQVKHILGEHLIGEPPKEEDTDHNTDLIVLRMEAVRIACRVREYQYSIQYPNEFTIRSSRPSGMKTELAKIMEGWGQYFFYGFSDKVEMGLELWRLIDLNTFRLWLWQYAGAHPGRLPGIQKPNHDGSSTFYAFSVRHPTAPTTLIVATNQENQVPALPF